MLIPKTLTIDRCMYRAGEEKDEAPQELVLLAPEPPVVAEVDLQRRPGKAAKPNKPSAKDQVHFLTDLRGVGTLLACVYLFLSRAWE